MYSSKMWTTWKLDVRLQDIHVRCVVRSFVTTTRQHRLLIIL